jgi:uncharacterized protein YbaR (Trm112 family)/SAM-dependent methyltransferase
MIPQDVKYLKCIYCTGRLSLEQYKSKMGDCKEGRLTCRECKESYPVINSIPRMLSQELLSQLVVPYYPEYFKKHQFEPSNTSLESKEKVNGEDKLKLKTADSFGFEWLKYPKILKHFERDWERFFNPNITKEDVKGRVVCDFGCGMAKHGHFIGKYRAKKYIGLDISLAVEACYKNTKKYNPLVVQADLYAPPINREKIDIYYSIGVLHHLPYPEAGFLSMTSQMKKGSKVLIWVYGRRKNFRALYLYNPVRVITTRIPKKIMYKLCHVPAVLLHSVNIFQKALAKAGLGTLASKLPYSYYTDFPYAFKLSDSYDVFATPKQVYYDMSEIRKWFRHAKLEDYKLEHESVQGIKGYAIKK